MTPPWSMQFCRLCQWRHDPAEPCDLDRLYAAEQARAKDVRPGEMIADTPRTWDRPPTQPAPMDMGISEADEFFRKHARIR